MKMVKSLLLGTAAGLVAMTGAQAADLPVKAKPVQYVKICSLYGAGFYYIPGTDMCLKVGGWVRQYMDWNANGSLTTGPLTLNDNTRGTQNFATRTRGYITADARNQTEYGTLRSYIAVGVSGAGLTAVNTPGDAASGASATFSANRAFIQLAGFTFGISQSFYDFFPTPALSYFGANINPSSDSGDGGKQLTAYTAQFGNGLSATISAEGQRNTSVFNSTAAGGVLPNATLGNVALTSSQKGMQFPDIVANLRIDQAWGSAQIMGVLHDDSARYYSSPLAVATQTTAASNPADAMGYALGAGLKLNAPMIGPGDYFDIQANYTVGASGYANNVNPAYVFYNGGGGGSMGFGVTADGVYGGTVAGANTTGVEKTTAWGVNAAYEHFWSKSWQSSLYGSYVKYQYSDLANRMLCAGEGAGTGIGTSAAITAGVTCNNNYAVWIAGSRTQWNIDSSTYLGLDIAYLGLQSAQIGPGLVNTPAMGGQPAALRTVQNQGAWIGQFRIHRNFYP